MADGDSVTADEKKGNLAAHAGVGTTGVAVGALGGALASKLVNDPIKFADYVLDKGPVGILLVIAIVLVFAVWKLYGRQTAMEIRHQRELATNAKAYQTELTARDSKYADKVENLMRDQVKLAQKCTRLMAKTEVVLRKYSNEEIGEDTLSDGDEDADEVTHRVP